MRSIHLEPTRRSKELAKSLKRLDVPEIGPQGCFCRPLSTTRGFTYLLKLSTEFVECVSVRSIGYSDVVNVPEAGDVELSRTFKN